MTDKPNMGSGLEGMPSAIELWLEAVAHEAKHHVLGDYISAEKLRRAADEIKELRSQLDKTWDSALERAAMLVDYYANRAISDYASPEWGCEEAAKEIRALKRGERGN